MPLQTYAAGTYLTVPYVGGTYNGYCLIGDVQELFVKLQGYSTLSPPFIANRITEAEAEMDASLNNYFIMPYGGTIFAQLFKQMNSRLAASLLYDLYFTGSEPNMNETAAQWRQYAELLMADMISGTIFLSDALANAEAPLYPLAAAATVAPNPNVDTTQTPIFLMDKPNSIITNLM